MPRSFGFEAEFASANVPDLMRALTDRGFANQREERVHQYHCGCDNCRDLHGTPFRGQRDSSCGGEVISGIFFDTPEGWDRAQAAMQALQDSALDVDATVDMRCGMHVHLGWAQSQTGPFRDQERPPDDWAGRRSLTLAWLAFEPLLWEYMVGSVWAERRSFNSAVSSCLVNQLRGDYELWPDGYPVEERYFNLRPADWNGLYKEHFERCCDDMAWDRHADLAMASHGGYYEFRIFNATRSAWRTELACRLSVLMSKRDFVQPIADRMERWLFPDDLQLRAERLWTMRHGFRERAHLTRQQQREGMTAPYRIASDLVMSLDEAVSAFREGDEQLGGLLDKQIAYQQARRTTGFQLSGLVVSNNIDVPGHGQVRELLGA